MSTDIWVIAERRENGIHSSTFELLGKARELADKAGGSKVCAVVLADEKPRTAVIETLYEGGADKVILAIHSALKRFDFQPYLKVLERIAIDNEPNIILAPATTTGRTIMPGLAAVLHTGLTADCTGLDIETETSDLLQTRPAIGGNIMATIKTPAHRPQMATVRPKTFSPLEGKHSGARELEEFVVETCLVKTGARLVSMKTIPDDQKNIQDAEIVIAGGKGLSKQDNMIPIEKMAKMVGGSIGASRPIVDSKWIGHEAQVGLSGHTVKPRVYIAAGISGAVQHIAGMQTSEFIVAINRDRNAPIFNFSDVGLVGDATEILETILERLDSLKGDNADD